MWRRTAREGHPERSSPTIGGRFGLVHRYDRLVHWFVLVMDRNNSLVRPLTDIGDFSQPQPGVKRNYCWTFGGGIGLASRGQQSTQAAEPAVSGAAWGRDADGSRAKTPGNSQPRTSAEATCQWLAQTVASSCFPFPNGGLMIGSADQQLKDHDQSTAMSVLQNTGHDRVRAFGDGGGRAGFCPALRGVVPGREAVAHLVRERVTGRGWPAANGRRNGKTTPGWRRLSAMNF